MVSMVLKWRILKTPEETQQAFTEAQHELEKAMTTLAEQEHLVHDMQASPEKSTSEGMFEGLRSELNK